MTQHPPPRSRFLPAPGNRHRTTHGAGTLSGMLPQSAEGSEELMRTAPQAGGRFPGQGIRLSEVSGSLRASFGRGLQRGKSGASSVPRGGKQPRAVSSSSVLFQAGDGKYSPERPPPSAGTMPTSLLLPGALPTWKELSRMNPCWSNHSSLPLLCSAPGFSSNIHRDESSCCWVSFYLLQPIVLHKAGIQWL